MRQSTVIFGTLLFAWVIYITLRGQLPSYLGLFKGKGSSGVTNAVSTVGEKLSPEGELAKHAAKATTVLKNMGIKLPDFGKSF